MNLTLLDNPIWYALNSHQRHLAWRGKLAARYQPGVSDAAAMLEYNTLGFNDLSSLVETDETLGVVGSLPKELTGWEILQVGQFPQMVCQALRPAPHVDAVNLTADDVPDILNLVALAQPGPFLSRTIEMGQYLGLRRNGRLVAMAGERLHLTGFCEISAVCTHPDYRGRGYAGALTTMVAKNMIARQEIPFLHVSSTNHTAIKLYKRLGFQIRREIILTILKKLAE